MDKRSTARLCYVNRLGGHMKKPKWMTKSMVAFLESDKPAPIPHGKEVRAAAWSLAGANWADSAREKKRLVFPPVTQALFENNPNKARMLAWAGTNLDEKDELGFTALTWSTILAARWAQDWTQLLLDEGANPEVEDSMGRNALHWAALGAGTACEAIAKKSPACMVARDFFGKTPLATAIESGSPDAICALARSGSSVEGLAFIERHNDREVRLAPLAKAFDRLHADRSVRDPSKGVMEWLGAIEALISAGALPSDSSLVERPGRGGLTMWEMAPVWENYFRAFSGLRSRSEDELLAPKTARILLQAGWDPNQTGSFGRTGLHCAARMGLTSVAELLLKAGGHAGALDDFKKSPLDLALETGRDDLSRMLRVSAEKETLESATAMAPAIRSRKTQRL